MFRRALGSSVLVAAPRRLFSTTAKAPRAPLVLRADKNGVATLTMNNPKKLNGWTPQMFAAIKEELGKCASDANAKAVVLTGSGKYYCAGVDLAGTMRPMHPRKLFESIIDTNQSLFDLFIDFPKPILIAANGPAIGASVTSATLCDHIIAADTATFNTPFARLGVTAEGCSSITFEKLMGEVPAMRMLNEGWVPSATDAKTVGLIQEVVPAEELLARAQAKAEEWVTSGKTTRDYVAGLPQEELKKINKEESERLAHAFFALPFLRGQYNFMRSKNKPQMAAVFWLLAALRPLWITLV